MINRKRLIEKFLNIAEHDCFTEEQFKIRQKMYNIISFLNRGYEKKHECVCDSCGGTEYDSNSVCLNCGGRVI